MYLCTQRRKEEDQRLSNVEAGNDESIDAWYRYLGEIDVEEERFLGVGHLNPVAAAPPAAAGPRPLRLAA